VSLDSSKIASLAAHLDDTAMNATAIAQLSETTELDLEDAYEIQLPSSTTHARFADEHGDTGYGIRDTRDVDGLALAVHVHVTRIAGVLVLVLDVTPLDYFVVGK